MDFDNPINPNRPYADKIELLKYLHDGQETGNARKSFPLPFHELFWDFRTFKQKKDTPEKESIAAFLNHIESLSNNTPTPEELEKAPHLDEWCAVHDGDVVILIGIVTGHPHISNQGRARTSLLFQVHPEAGWARTWNRYYRLGTPSRMTFFEWQYEGKLSPAMQIVEFD